MIILQNERVYLEIAERGAEMRRLTVAGNDVLWSGDPAYWAGVAPILFPLCGGTLQDEYIYNGKTYPMPKHGFIRFMDFAVAENGDDFVTMVHTANDETKAQYLWDYALYVTYRLLETGVDVTYRVHNRSEDTMLFSIGAHEGYACPEGIEQYDVVFPENETLRSHLVVGNLLSYETVTVLEDGNVLSLKNQYFEQDALVFKNIRSRSCTLRNRCTGREVKVQFPDSPYLLLWTKVGAPYLCIEPWNGIPTFYDQPQILEQKEGIIHLPADEMYTLSHTISL